MMVNWLGMGMGMVCITKTILQILFGLLVISSITGADNMINYECSHSNFYSLGSSFQQNLNYTLFTILPENASLVHFSNFSAGGINNDNDSETVYAIYLCKGDMNLQGCSNCVQVASKRIVQLCPLCKQGIVWYQDCMLRYDNLSIFSLEDHISGHASYNSSSSELSDYNMDKYQSKFDTVMDGLIKKAAYNRSLKLQGFATTQVELSSSQTLGASVQCTPDILNTPCDRCLRAALKLKTTWFNDILCVPSCVVRFYVSGSPDLPPPTPSRAHDPRKVVAIALPSTVGFILLLGSCWFLKTRCHARATDDSSEEEMPDIAEHDDRGRAVAFSRFSYSEVEIMTSGFQRKLGEGGYGSVYYGHLTDGNTQVAVKLLSKDAPNQFSTEIEVFGKICHKNLVSLIGYCQEGTNLALIYEYMAGRDLKAFLSGSDSFSWKKRLEIAIDSAQGLDYLHNGCRPPIVHRDVKSPNILLNQHLRAKIADFGFSKIFPDEYVSVLSTRVIGSPGYVDPQYHLTGQLNEKSDVYSFGVVLLELITGKAAIASGEATLVQWVKPVLERGDMDNIVDPRLQQVENRGSVWRATDLAMQCVKFNATERPTMSLIVTELKDCLVMAMDMDMAMAMETDARRSPNSMEIMSVAALTFSTMEPTPR